VSLSASCVCEKKKEEEEEEEKSEAREIDLHGSVGQQPE